MSIVTTAGPGDADAILHPMSSRPVAATLAAVLLVVACAGPAAAPSAAPSAAEATPAASASASSVACDRPAASPPPGAWWRDRVFYEVFVRSFADSDGDGIGDLRGLTAHLDYLNDGDPATTDDLGVTGLWLMPIAESPSYHGYDVVDYRTVEPDYGTADDLRALVAAAHERGIAVIVDLVINHTSLDHPWFQDARAPGSSHDDWYVWSDEHPGVARPDGAARLAPGRRPLLLRLLLGGHARPQPREPGRHRGARSTSPTSGSTTWASTASGSTPRGTSSRTADQLENTHATFDWLRGFREPHQDRPPGRARARRGLGRDVDVVALRPRRRARPDVRLRPGERHDHVAALGRCAARCARRWQEVTELYPAGGLATFLTNHDQDRIMTELDGDPAAAGLAGGAAAHRGRAPRSSTTARRSG